jgi:hypothetical protein
MITLKEKVESFALAVLSILLVIASLAAGYFIGDQCSVWSAVAMAGLGCYSAYLSIKTIKGK